MRPGIQTFLDEAGDAACYALDIINIAEEVIGQECDASAKLLAGIDRGYIHYSWDNEEDDDNFYVTDPSGFLSYLTGRKWTVRKEMPAYQANPGEFVVQRWERVKTGMILGHFRRPEWDSLTSSMTVKLGKIASLRVFSRV